MSGPRLSIIPARACTDPALKPRDLQVLCVLGRHTNDLGWCRPSQVKMAAAIGCARSTVFEAISRLVEAGYVERHVHEEANGRDSPHSYRVILDQPHANVSSIARPDGDDSTATPPADQSAPPAGISAPPAGPGPAPKNDPSRTIERDAREEPKQEAVRPPAEQGNRQEAEKPSADDLRKIDAEGWALLKNWPGFAGMPKEPALAIWRTLPADERATARLRFLPWLELLRRQKKSHVPAPSTYLREKLWRDVADPAEAPAPPALAKPFGKLFSALRMRALLAGPGPLPEPRGLVAHIIAEGGERGEREQLSHQARHGWPEVNRMHAAASDGRALTVARGDEPSEAVLQMMEAVREGSPEWAAWAAHHERMGWPWLPDPGEGRWVWMPACGPDGLDAFQAAVSGEAANLDARKSDDGGGQEAAE